MLFRQIVNGSLGENAYLIAADGQKTCAVIDPGEAEPVLAALKREGLSCEAILLTHGHFDHIGGVKQLKDETGAKIYIHEADAGMLTSSRMSLAVLIGTNIKHTEPDVLLKGGETLAIAGLDIRVIHTPGHTKGGVCYAIASERVLLSGDTLFHTDAGRTDFPGGSAKDLYHSIKDQLYTLEGDYTVYPGHEESTTLDEERQSNTFTCAGDRRGW
ncbi:MAG: MBL fold metallo-hydrolase [Clostridiaceae bacterium]